MYSTAQLPSVAVMTSPALRHHDIVPSVDPIGL
jgi:hypothetical protein